MEFITIIFIGLIAHITTTSGVETSVLVRATNHLPQMMIFRENGTSDGPFNLTDTYLTISSAGANVATNKMFAAGSIPELTDIGQCGKLKATVDARIEDALVDSFIDHQEGYLFPLAYQEMQIHFANATKWKNQRCAACGAELVLPVATGKSVTITIASIKDKANPYASLKIKRSDVVVIRHAPSTTSSSSGTAATDHFPHFYELFDDCKYKDKVTVKDPCKTTQICKDVNPAALPLNVLNVPKVTAQASGKAIITSMFNRKEFVSFIVTPTIECTNSQYP